MTRFPQLPHRTPSNVSAAIYGLILGASIIAATSVDHTDQQGVVEIYREAEAAPLRSKGQLPRILAFCTANSSSVRIPCSLSCASSFSCSIADAWGTAAAG